MQKLFQSRLRSSSNQTKQICLCKEMFVNFKRVLESGFSYKKSLEREQIKQESVDLLREKIKDSKVVPKSLTDKQVKALSKSNYKE